MKKYHFLTVIRENRLGKIYLESVTDESLIDWLLHMNSISEAHGERYHIVFAHEITEAEYEQHKYDF